MKEKTPFNCNTCNSSYKTKLGITNTFYQLMKIKDLDVQNVMLPLLKTGTMNIHNKTVHEEYNPLSCKTSDA